MLTFIIFFVIAYLCGSLSSAILICKFLNLPDPRTQGSGNPGATNILRFGGKKAAAWVLVGDILKGFIPVLFASIAGISHTSLGLIALAAVLGHMLPVFFHFKGGKGVATALGTLLAMSPTLAIAVALTWLAVAAISRYSSLAALVAAACTPIYNLWLSEQSYYVAFIIIAAAIVTRHYRNIENLLNGTENKIGKKQHPVE